MSYLNSMFDGTPTTSMMPPMMYSMMPTMSGNLMMEPTLDQMDTAMPSWLSVTEEDASGI